MYVCVCKGITDKQIKQAVAEGAESLREVKQQLEVASQCGKCVKAAQRVIDQAVVESARYYQVA